jgi:hypothetical protein
VGAISFSKKTSVRRNVSRSGTAGAPAPASRHAVRVIATANKFAPPASPVEPMRGRQVNEEEFSDTIPCGLADRSSKAILR